MAHENDAPSIALLTLAALLITCLIVDSVLRPPVIETSVAALHASVTTAPVSNPCPAAAPCTFNVYDDIHDACTVMYAAPGTACTSPCGGAGICAPVGNCLASLGQCTGASDCIWALSPLAPNDTEVMCVQGQCQLHVHAPFVTLEEHALVLVAPPCAAYLSMDQTCIRETSRLVPMALTRHKEARTQYRVCQFVFM